MKAILKANVLYNDIGVSIARAVVQLNQCATFKIFENITNMSVLGIIEKTMKTNIRLYNWRMNVYVCVCNSECVGLQLTNERVRVCVCVWVRVSDFNWRMNVVCQTLCTLSAVGIIFTILRIYHYE